MEVRRKRHIGRLLERARKNRGLSADQVAVQCNVNRSCVYQWEKRTYVMPKNLSDLSSALRLPLRVLQEENAPIKKNDPWSNMRHHGVYILDALPPRLLPWNYLGVHAY